MAALLAHQQVINALQERLQHAKDLKERLSKAEKSIHAIVNGGVAQGAVLCCQVHWRVSCVGRSFAALQKRCCTATTLAKVLLDLLRS